ncbi:MAG: hypothetical protein U9O87_11065 [Verrucomicrobiota bacterium]|nr:hypothetical protein [Verrucomicrobiota bacterium]
MYFRKKRIFVLFLLLFLGVFSSKDIGASIPVTPETVLAISKAAPATVNLVKDVVALPLRVGKIFRLPLGLVETVLAPLPGLTFANGITNTGNGIAGIFEFVGAVLKLPVSAVGSTLQTVGLYKP